jgi:hypothetical protein
MFGIRRPSRKGSLVRNQASVHIDDADLEYLGDSLAAYWNRSQSEPRFAAFAASDRASATAGAIANLARGSLVD